MLEGVGEIFNDYKGMLKKLKKKQYKERTDYFRREYGHYFDDMNSLIEESENREATMSEISNTICDEVFNKHKFFGKIPGFAMIDLSFHLIYYVFPTILASDKEYSNDLAENLRVTWNERFGEKINSFADYETLHGGFNEKIFGMF